MKKWKSTTKDIKRNRKDKNLAGLYAISNENAYKNGKIRKGVYGVVNKDTPFICKPSVKEKNKSREFIRDTTDIPKKCFIIP